MPNLFGQPGDKADMARLRKSLFARQTPDYSTLTSRHSAPHLFLQILAELPGSLLDPTILVVFGFTRVVHGDFSPCGFIRALLNQIPSNICYLSARALPAENYRFASMAVSSTVMEITEAGGFRSRLFQEALGASKAYFSTSRLNRIARFHLFMLLLDFAWHVVYHNSDNGVHVASLAALFGSLIMKRTVGQNFAKLRTVEDALAKADPDLQRASAAATQTLDSVSTGAPVLAAIAEANADFFNPNGLGLFDPRKLVWDFLKAFTQKITAECGKLIPLRCSKSAAPPNPRLARTLATAAAPRRSAVFRINNKIFQVASSRLSEMEVFLRKMHPLESFSSKQTCFHVKSKALRAASGRVFPRESNARMSIMAYASHVFSPMRAVANANRVGAPELADAGRFFAATHSTPLRASPRTPPSAPSPSPATRKRKRRAGAKGASSVLNQGSRSVKAALNRAILALSDDSYTRLVAAPDARTSQVIEMSKLAKKMYQKISFPSFARAVRSPFLRSFGPRMTVPEFLGLNDSEHISFEYRHLISSSCLYHPTEIPAHFRRFSLRSLQRSYQRTFGQFQRLNDSVLSHQRMFYLQSESVSEQIRGLQFVMSFQLSLVNTFAAVQIQKLCRGVLARRSVRQSMPGSLHVFRAAESIFAAAQKDALQDMLVTSSCAYAPRAKDIPLPALITAQNGIGEEEISNVRRALELLDKAHGIEKKPAHLSVSRAGGDLDPQMESVLRYVTHRKKNLKVVLKKFDDDFMATYRRVPTHVDKRPLVDFYKEYKTLRKHAERLTGPLFTITRPASGSVLRFRSSSPTATSGSVSARANPPRARAEEPAQPPSGVQRDPRFSQPKERARLITRIQGSWQHVQYFNRFVDSYMTTDVPRTAAALRDRKREIQQFLFSFKNSFEEFNRLMKRAVQLGIDTVQLGINAEWKEKLVKQYFALFKFYKALKDRISDDP